MIIFPQGQGRDWIWEGLSKYHVFVPKSAEVKFAWWFREESILKILLNDSNVQALVWIYRFTLLNANQDTILHIYNINILLQFFQL